MNIFSVLYQQNYYELLICYPLLTIRKCDALRHNLTMVAIQAGSRQNLVFSHAAKSLQ